MTKHLPKIGSIYCNSTGKRFIVDKLAHAEHDPWIEYRDLATKQHYTCRLPAFLDRFFLEQPRRPRPVLTF